MYSYYSAVISLTFIAMTVPQYLQHIYVLVQSINNRSNRRNIYTIKYLQHIYVLVQQHQPLYVLTNKP